MPRFDRGVVNTKLEKGDIVLMGNPTQYGEILAENILVEDILKADLETLISGSNLVRGKFYRITNAVSSTLSLLVQGLTANTICDYAYNTANGELVAYNISTDLASVPFASIYVPYTGATTDVNLGANDITANAIIKSGGTSSQFLKADGSVDSNTYITTISGISVGGELSGTLPNPSLVTSAVTGKPLTGLSVSGSAVVSTDTILQGIGKLQNQINAVVGSVNFQGVWNASTNSPSLASGVGTKGYYYVVSVAGSTNLDGITDWKLGDWAIYDGTAWQKVDNTDAVVSVNGYTGIVTLAAADVGALPTSAISGTTGKLPKFTASGTIGDSIVSESGGNIGINIITPSGIGTTLNLYGTTSINSNVVLEGNNGDSFMSLLSSATPNVPSVIMTKDGLRFATATNKDATGFNEYFRTTSTELITFGATDTGEAHIFGGSARVNGNTTIIGSSTWNPVDNALETLRIYRGNTAPFLAQSTFIDTSGGNTNIRNNSTDSARTINLSFSIDGTSNYTTKLSLSNTELITFGATDTGEAHIFGGSARVNGDMLITSNLDINGTTLNLGNNTIVDSYTGNSSTYRVLVLTDQTANTNIGLNYNPISNVGSAFNGTGQIFIAHNKGIIASNAAGNNYIGVLRPIGTGVYFGGSLSSGELVGDGLFISTTGAATFSQSVTAGGSVGVGGTNTDSLLTINGTAGTSQARFREGSTTVGFVGGANGIITGHNGKLALRAEAGLVLSGQGNAADFIITSTGKINMPSLPTSSAGLSTGDVWNDGGTLKIV